MAESNGHATIKIDDEKIKERIRDLLAQAWDQGWDACAIHKAGCDYMGPGTCRDMPLNPYRSDAS